MNAWSVNRDAFSLLLFTVCQQNNWKLKRIETARRAVKRWRRTSLADYCNIVLASSPSDKLQRVLNAAACLVSGTRKYDRGLSQILHADLHWLDEADRVRYKLGVTVHRYLHNKVSQHLVDCFVPVSDIASRQWLRSARRCLLTVPGHRRIAHSAVGHSQSSDPLSGTCFETNSETPTALSLHSGRH